ncbi:MAG TPA: phospholipase D-like domain-containing protein [Balneolaceae bacterium]|nr:phospholipase D-like domain-containing protein [Balneolaceae bacterium]
MNQYRYVLENTLGIPFSEGNSVDVLINGDEIFPAMLEAIRNAEHRIDFLTFVYWTGEVAENFAQALAQKADEGLDVRVILDSYGAAFMPAELADLMIDSGVKLRWFRPISQWKVWKSDNRSHRKVLICDAKTGFTGGVGIAKEWEGDARNPSEFRDTHFRIQGEAVKGLQAAFMENWIETEGFLPMEPTWEDGVENPTSGNAMPVQTVRTSASVRWSDIVMLYQTLIKMARESILIGTAYFNPNDIMSSLLIEAVERGVDVQILMPGKYSDERLAKLAGEETFEKLLNGGVKLWYYQKTMYHTKKIIVDGIVSCIGSANFNHRSMLKDDEINLVCLDKNLADELTNNFKDDLKYAVPLKEEQWSKRSILQWSKEKLVALGRQEL